MNSCGGAGTSSGSAGAPLIIFILADLFLPLFICFFWRRPLLNFFRQFLDALRELANLRILRIPFFFELSELTLEPLQLLQLFRYCRRLIFRHLHHLVFFSSSQHKPRSCPRTS